MNASPALGSAGGWPQASRAAAAGIGLWVFMGVATSLFSLFLVAYLMRISAADGAPIALPWQTGLATALLLTGSWLLQWASGAARGADPERARRLLQAGGACALAFLAAQLWAWQALLAAQVAPAGNPAASFFFLLTAMHGLHVAGGIAAWAWTLRALARTGAQGPAAWAWRVALLARYWHFLLAVWLALFAALGWLTPELARLVCGVDGGLS
ncbi:bb3-type cytochrome oxidase subunit III [Ramlibacter sp. 2FC]|uniref:cytochrome c oxidase subunit 3 n=1 Tax=Ramlibacter sp. 2FC TaxID=2502188 RepID=UPI0010F9A5D0|nr:bb3-type cytochrome oxidase subunit III [Ramlibacter sp. 2FC]